MTELRELRDGAGLGHAELAARAHYPYDSIRAAEVGPGLPELPVLSAYVRGCGGTTEEWEERWRSLTRTPSLPVPAARHVGRSAAAAAGARLNSSGQDGESPNPAIIIAALNRVAEEMAASKSDTPSGPTGRPTRPAPAAEAAPAVPAPAAPEDRAPAQVTDLPTRPAPAFQAPPPPAAATPAAPPAAAAAEKAEPAAEGKPAAEWDQLAASGKPASAWDPIRMSSAWPALRSTPGDTGSSGGASSSASASSSGNASTSGSPGSSGAATSSGAAGSSGVTGQGTPWGTVPWAEEPARRPAATARATGSAVPANAGSGSTVASGFTGSRTRLIVIAAIALVVLIVLLAIFA